LLVSATGNAHYANLSVNTNLTGQLRSSNRPLDHVNWVGLWVFAYTVIIRSGCSSVSHISWYWIWTYSRYGDRCFAAADL